MMGFKSIARVIVALVLIASMTAVVHGAVIAQDAGTPVVASNDSVSISCVHDDGVDQSKCAFTLNEADSLAPSAFIINASQLCGHITKIGTTSWTGDGNLSQDVSANGPTATLTFSGTVTASTGGGTYGLELGGQSSTISGDSISCASAVQAAALTANSANAANASSGDGNSGNAAPSVVNVSIPISFYDCTADPLATDPATNAACSVVTTGIEIGVTINGTSIGPVTSNSSGIATFDAPAGSAVVVTEQQSTIPAGFSPYGDGQVSFTAAQGISRTFVHLPSADQGRLQIVSGTCPTSGASRTTFRVVEPALRTAAAASCASTPNVPFTITGGGLGAGLAVTTDSGGNWRGFLPSGDYTITSANATTAGFTVYSGQIVVVVAIDYVAQPTGTFNIARWQCSTDPNAAVTIHIGATAPTDPTGCTASNGKVTLLEVGSSANPAEIVLGDGGIAHLDLKPSSYVLTDETSGVSATFDIAGGQTLYATITGGPAAGAGSAGNGSDGNSGNGSGNGADGNGSGDGNASGNGAGDPGNGAGSNSTDGGGSGAANGAGNGAGNGTGVNALPNTGVHQARTGDSLPLLGGVAGLLGLVIVTIYLHRRKNIAFR